MRRLLPFIIVIVVLIGLVAAIPLLLSSNRYKPQVEQALSKRLNHRVTMQTLNVKLLPPALELENVAVFGTGQSNPVFEAPSIRAPLALPMLLKAKIVPSEAIITKGILWVRRQPDGSWVSVPLTNASGASVDSGLPVDRIVLKDSMINFLDSFAPTEQRLQAQNLNGEFFPSKKTVSLQGQLLGMATPLTLKLETKNGGTALSLTESNSTLTARWLKSPVGPAMRIESVVWRWDNLWSLARFFGRFSANLPGAPEPLLIRHLSADVQTTSSSTTYKLTAKLDKGDVEAQGSVLSQSGVHTRLQGALALRDVAVTALPDAHGLGGSLSGTLSGLSNYELVISSQIHRDVFGTVTAEVHDGIYRFPEATVAAVKRAKTLAYLRKKYPDFETKGLSFAKLRMAAKLDGALVTWQEGTVEAGDVRVKFAGTFDAARSGMDLWTRLNLQEKNPALRKLLPGRYITGSVGKEKILPLYGHAQGTPMEWAIKSVPAAKTPAAVKK